MERVQPFYSSRATDEETRNNFKANVQYSCSAFFSIFRDLKSIHEMHPV